ncbi:hypothetical protein AC26_2625 [Escherichia coli 1-176-05_S3_C2]|nr:hypothetical protein AC26_2625 [Escherichia coli 1-176-05_S3_C2]
MTTIHDFVKPVSYFRFSIGIFPSRRLITTTSTLLITG